MDERRTSMSVMSQRPSLAVLTGFVLTICVQLRPAMGQVNPAQQPQPSSKTTQIRPVSQAHLYWHFLVYQNHLDTKAAEQDSQGKDGGGLRNLLQKEAGLSDADYAPSRISSVRLAAEVKDLDAQAIAIRKIGVPLSNRDHLHALTLQREADITAEISYLKQNLPPDKIRAFEAFLTRFFSPANAVPRPPSSAGPQAPAAVQQ